MLVGPAHAVVLELFDHQLLGWGEHGCQPREGRQCTASFDLAPGHLVLAIREDVDLMTRGAVDDVELSTLVHCLRGRIRIDVEVVGNASTILGSIEVTTSMSSVALGSP